VSFDYAVDTRRHAAIRAYVGLQAVTFSVAYGAEAANVAPFPALSRYPNLPYHLTYSGFFAIPSFPGFGDEGPWIFFDGNANTFVISPMANYLVARTTHGPGGAISSGISSQIATIPKGFEHQTILIADTGINRAFDAWGGFLTRLAGKIQPAGDSSPFLNRLGYWTDAGAAYYYQTEPGLAYQDTLARVKAGFDSIGVALGYLQLDSWFYPKGALADWRDGSGGIYEYSAAPELFSPSLQAFQQTLGVPLITHARWIDASSPARRDYLMSGNVCIDPKYWKSTADYLASSGVGAYEQDWLGDQAHTDFNLTDPYAFLDNMAAAMAERGLSMQYSMANPSHFLQSTRYANLTNIRVSEDRFDRSRWTELLYTGRLAWALGVRPFPDVTMSSETDNLLLATLAAGPLGVGDPIGSLSRENLLRAVRPDGVIVKPDLPIVPLDQSFIDTAGGADKPMLASTYTDFDDVRAYYVFAHTQGTDTLVSFRPADLGVVGPAYVYDYFADSGTIVDSQQLYSASVANGRAYYIVVPLGPSGIALLGDRGHFVSLGKNRIPSLADDGVVHVGIAFAPGETSRTLFGFSPVAPAAIAVIGDTGPLTYDPSTQRFTVDVTPGADAKASVDLFAPAPTQVSGHVTSGP
jgi:hypothetical protein